jgi:hypothetical protein
MIGSIDIGTLFSILIFQYDQTSSCSAACNYMAIRKQTEYNYYIFARSTFVL